MIDLVDPPSSNSNGAVPVAHAPYVGPSLPDDVWLPPFDQYRAAVGDSTEAADEHHYGAFRAVAGAYLGRRVEVNYGRSLYTPDNVVLIGPTHDKKTTAQRRAVDFAARITRPVATIAALNSAEGLCEWVASCDMTPPELAAFFAFLKSKTGAPWVPLNPEHRRGLAVIEEMAVVLQKAKMDGSASLIATLTQLYDMPDIIAPALRAHRFVAEKPTFTVLGASTAEWMTQNLSRADIMGGFGNRQQFFTGPAKPPKPLPDPPDDVALDLLAREIEARFAQWRPGTEFKLTAAAKKVWAAFYVAWTNTAQAEGDVPTSRLESRIPEHIMKLALLYAALGNDVPEITEVHMEAAIHVGLYLRGSVRFAFGDSVDTGETPSSKLERRILELLKSGPAKKRDLQQNSKQRNTTSVDFNRALDGLKKVGTISVGDDGSVSLA